MNEVWAAILGSLIAAIAATFGLVITKENKISEFRQTWISELRNLLTNYSSMLVKFNLDGDIPAHGNGDKAEQISKLTSEINLRLNLKKPSDNEKNLVAQMKILSDSLEKHPSLFMPLIYQFNEASFEVLKEEWKRVKKGEAKYRACLWGCIGITYFISMLVFIYTFFHFEQLVNFLTK